MSASHPTSDTAAKAPGTHQKTGLVLAALILIAAAGAGWWLLYGRGTTPAPAAGGRAGRAAAGPMPVGTAAVSTGNLDIYLNTIGNVRALNTVTVRTLVNGTLQKVYFTEGAFVKAGDRLADVDPRPFEVQKLQAEGQLARDRALLANAKRDLVRYKDAAEAVTQQQIDLATSTVAQYEGAVITDQAAVDNAALQLTYSHIVSPVSGRAGLRQVDEGNVVNTGDTTGIVVITQLQPISVIFTVPESDLRRLSAAVAKNPALKVIAFDRDNTTLLADGALSALDNQVDATTGTVKLRANFDNKDSGLFPNQFVNVRVLVGTRENIVLVPTVAVQISDKDRYVYVVDTEGSVERRTVKTGDFDDKSTEIVEGVKPGEIVVTEGLDRLRTGSKVISSNSARHAAGTAGKAGAKPGKKHPQKPKAE